MSVAMPEPSMPSRLNRRPAASTIRRRLASLCSLPYRATAPPRVERHIAFAPQIIIVRSYFNSEEHPMTATTTRSDQQEDGEVITSYVAAPTRTVSVGGVDFAYRELGPATGVPVIFLHHLAAVLDNWDPRVLDGIAAHHRVIAFDNRGVGASGGSTPDTIEAMAHDAVAFIRALRLEK